MPLGIILRNENKVDEMSRIMDELHKYVPAKDIHCQNILPNGETDEETTEKLYQVLFGGDQLTVARARSAIGMRRTHDSNKEKLQGLIPVVEDWHARVTLLQVYKNRKLLKYYYISQLHAGNIQTTNEGIIRKATRNIDAAEEFN